MLCALAAAWVGANPVAAQVCTSDADCEDGFACEKGASTPGCDPSGGPCADAGVTIAEMGYCEPKPIVCETALDCPEGLACESGGDTGTCTSSRDGGTTCEPDEPSAKQCVYAPTECTSDDDCDADYACTVLATTQECSGGGPACAPGESCPDPTPDMCTTRELKSCFPKRVDCRVDGDCNGDWNCVEIPEDARGEDAPAGWQDATAVCFPEGLALVAQGRVEGGGTFAPNDGASGGGEPTRDETEKSSGDGGICSATKTGARPSLPGAFVVLGAMVGLAARRRARR
jgi:hypothetical protein